VPLPGGNIPASNRRARARATAGGNGG